jgi:hypothetical protein
LYKAALSSFGKTCCGLVLLNLQRGTWRLLRYAARRCSCARAFTAGPCKTKPGCTTFPACAWTSSRRHARTTAIPRLLLVLFFGRGVTLRTRCSLYSSITPRTCFGRMLADVVHCRACLRTTGRRTERGLPTRTRCPHHTAIPALPGATFRRRRIRLCCEPRYRAHWVVGPASVRCSGYLLNGIPPTALCRVQLLATATSSATERWAGVRRVTRLQFADGTCRHAGGAFSTPRSPPAAAGIRAAPFSLPFTFVLLCWIPRSWWTAPHTAYHTPHRAWALCRAWLAGLCLLPVTAFRSGRACRRGVIAAAALDAPRDVSTRLYAAIKAVRRGRRQVLFSAFGYIPAFYDVIPCNARLADGGDAGGVARQATRRLPARWLARSAILPLLCGMVLCAAVLLATAPSCGRSHTTVAIPYFRVGTDARTPRPVRFPMHHQPLPLHAVV